ncbi:metallophosphoesterase, partial [Verrucomicrobia bacterium]|nr:metallophosphoesterase [Verrucomicrobiota bacterium]
LAKEAEAKEAERLAKEAEAKEAERLAKEAEAKEAEHLAKEAEAKEAERLAKEAEAKEAERLAKEAEAKEAERLAKEAEAKEAERLAKEAKPIPVPSAEVEWDKLAEEVVAAKDRQEGDSYKDPEEILNGLKKLLKQDRLGLWFDDCRGDEQHKVFEVDVEHAPDPEKDDVWFFGDIHGDLLGVLAAIEYAKKKSAEDNKVPYYVFLGDFTDRGPLDHLVLLKLYSMVLDETLRNRICIIAGNHDECLEYNDGKKEFYATVVPAEFTDWLNNDRKGDEVWQELGKATIEFFKRMPRAVFLPDGLFFAHAGVPHTDLHGEIDSLEALNKKQCLEDFVWARAHERAPKRRPNRNTRGHSFGRKDFYAFCEIAGKLLEQPVERMLRGHDHYLDGYKHYERYVENQMLTLNTRCIQPDTMGGPHAPYLCVARWAQDKLPKVHQIATDEAALGKVHPAPVVPKPEDSSDAEGSADKSPAGINPTDAIPPEENELNKETVDMNTPEETNPKSGEATPEEPATKEPAPEEPATKEPATEEPATEESATEESATEESATEEPVTEEPAAEEPATEEAVTEDARAETSSESLVLESQDGANLTVRIKTSLGKSAVSKFGEDAQFWSEPQFTLGKNETGDWEVYHDSEAQNETLLNGKAVTRSEAVKDGDELAVGREAKGIVKLPLKVSIS